MPTVGVCCELGRCEPVEARAGLPTPTQAGCVMISCYRLIDTPDQISEKPPRGGISFCAGRFMDVCLWPLADIG
jgi:hypothetical protein